MPPPRDTTDELRTGTTTLYGYGRLPWADLCTAVDGCTAAWADYDGFHIAHLPRQAPPYTHVWAWSSDWLLRARIDAGHAVVAVLQTGDATPVGMTSRASWQVRFIRRDAHTWSSGEKRVGRLAPEVVSRGVELWQIDGELPDDTTGSDDGYAHEVVRPVTFVRVR